MAMFEKISPDIENYCLRLERLTKSDGALNEQVEICLPMLKKILASPKGFDVSARLCVEWFGQYLEEIILNKKTDKESVNELCRYLSRIARESTFRTPYMAKSPEKELMEYYDYGKDFKDSGDRENCDFIWAILPRYVVKEYLEDVAKREEVFNESKAHWAAEVKGYKDTIGSYIEVLKEQRGRFNFVYLSKAFHEMHGEKKKELRFAFLSMIVLGLVVVFPLVYQFVFGSVISIGAAGLVMTEAGKLISLVGLEIALLYFFRIALKNYYSVKAQLLQLELRLSLCGFIESYADFAKTRKSKDVDPLAKFESIIFAGITPDESNVPSTFDGVEQLLKIAKEFKAK